MKKSLTLLLTLFCTLASFAAGEFKVSALSPSEELGVLSIEPASGNVESLQTFKISYADGIKLTNATGDPIRILKQDQTEVASVAHSTLQFEEVAEGSVPTYCTFTLSEAITAEGSYLLYIPSGIFTLGTGENAITNSNQNLTYDIVAAEAPAADIVTVPADGSTVTELNKILITFSKIFTADYNPAINATVTDAEGNSAASTVLWGWGDGSNQLTVQMSPITTSGTYTVTLPVGSVILDNAASTEEYKFTYTVQGAAPKFYTTNPEEGNVASLSVVVLTFTNASEAGVGGGKVSVKKDGTEVATIDATYGTGWNQLELKYSATENGTYTFDVPADHVILDGVNAPAFTLTYTIGEGGGNTPAPTNVDFASLTPGTDTAIETATDFIMTFSSDAVGYGVWQLNDLNATNPDEANLYTGQIKKQEDGSWKAHAYYPLTLYQNHEYELVVKVYDSEDSYNYQYEPIATLKAKYTGNTKPYEYAAANYVSASPADYSTLVSLAEKDITLTFDAAVETIEAEVNGGLFGGTKCTATANDTKTVWTVSIPESVLSGAKGSFNVVIVAKDAEGRLVKGNEGENENSIINLTYLCYLGAPDFTVTPANGSTVGSISTIVASYPAGINVSGSCTEPIKILNGETVVAELTTENVGLGDLDNSGENYTTATITLATPITANGTYTVVFPTTFFMLDNQTSSCCSKEQKVEITVDATVSIKSVSSDSVSGAIFTISGQRVNAPVNGINIINGKKVMK